MQETSDFGHRPDDGPDGVEKSTIHTEISSLRLAILTYILEMHMASKEWTQQNKSREFIEMGGQ